jgi:hypothetical protein
VRCEEEKWTETAEKMQQLNLEFNLVFIVIEKAFDEVFFMCNVNASSVNCIKLFFLVY